MLTLLFVCYFNLSVLSHPFHVSVADIQYSPSSKSLQITHKIFLDDIETALKKNADHMVDIIKLEKEKKLDPYIKKYIQEHFEITVNGKPLPVSYVGAEVQEEALWCYYEVLKVPVPKKVQVRSSFLYGIYDDQVNLVHVTVNREIKSMKLTTGNPEGSVAF